MLRPATPLTVLLFGAFGLLVLSIISTPIVKFIPLASFAGIDFGVFGFCTANNCSPIEVGYNTSTLFNDAQSSTFDLSSSTRATLSTILIVHPVAAFLTLIMLILAASAHFHAPSHSPRYLLIIFILSILTLFAALLSFLIDILLFVPHMAWGSYLVLAATILVAMSGIISCAMRRTLVSRKARKRRVAENAEMNGENFSNQLGLNHNLTSNGNTAILSNFAQSKSNFATFDAPIKEKIIEVTNDERTPLTLQKTDENFFNGRVQNEVNRLASPQTVGNLQTQKHYRIPLPQPIQDQFDFEPQRQNSNTSLNRLEATLPMQTWQRGGMIQSNNVREVYRGGRGGPGPQIGGFRPQLGGFRFQRGAFGSQRGGGGSPPSLPRPRGNYHGPPRGYPRMRGMQGRGGGPPRYDGQPPRLSNGNDFPPDIYDNRPPLPIKPEYNPYVLGPTSGYSTYNPGNLDSPLPVAESPPPLLSETPPQLLADSPPPLLAEFERPIFNEISDYNNNESRSATRQPLGQSQPFYYTQNETSSVNNTSIIPPPLTARSSNRVGRINTMIPAGNDENLDDFVVGPRSPADSESSEFTSISQRGINPNWKDDGKNQAPIKALFHRKLEKQHQQDILFQANPDFSLPVGRGGRGMLRGRGR